MKRGAAPERVRAYGVAFAALAACFLVRLLLQPLLQERSPFLLFIPAVIVAGLYGGVRPGVLVTLASLVLGTLFFVEPYGRLWTSAPDALTNIAAFALTAASMLWLVRQRISAEMRAAEAQLSSTERQRNMNALLSAVIESTPDPIYGKDLQGRMTLLNNATARVFGRPVDAVLGRLDRELLPPGAADGIEAADAAVLAGETRVLEERIWDAERGWRDYLSTKSPLRSADGSVSGLVGVSRDITERKAAEEALRVREAQYRAIVDTAVDAIVVIDERGMIQTVNPAVQRVFGYAPGELIGANVSVLMSDVHRGSHDGYVRSYVGGGAPKIIGIGREVEGRRKDGSTFALDLSIAEWRADDRQFFTGVMRDVSARKQAEAEVLRLNRELEARVQTRTRQLQEANGELQAFAYSVAHDLRAPLRAMKGFSLALTEDYGDRLDETGREYLARIDDGASRLDLLIQDLLAYSRLTREEIRLERVELDAALDEALLQLGTASAGARISVERPLPAVLAHPGVLVQIVANLLSNAVKFVAPDVVPEVTVRSERRADGRVRLWVEDNGIGIAPEHQARVFEVFQRLHGMTQYSGTGIGLAIVRKGAERMDGASGVVSEPGRGSRFWVELGGA